MPMYNLIECSDNYSDTSGSRRLFKGDEVPADNVDLAVVNNSLKSESFKYRAALVGKSPDAAGTNDLTKQYNKVRKVSIGQGNDYTKGCLLDYPYFKDNYRLIAVDLSKQKALDADPRAIQRIVFQGVVIVANNSEIRLYTILEKSKETILAFCKGTTKVL